jgi:hypothetical protein
METRTRRYAGWAVGIATGLLLIWFSGPLRPPQLLDQWAPVPPDAPIVTIDAPAGQGETISVWDSRLLQGHAVARLRPGDKVTLLQQTDQGARIETADGTRGWVAGAVIRARQDDGRTRHAPSRGT